MKTNKNLIKKIICSLFIFTFHIITLQAIFSSDFYWEYPQDITKSDSRFPFVASNGNKSYIFWQDIDKKNECIYLSCRYQNEMGEWKENLHFIGPFAYSGDVPDMYSAAVSNIGNIAVAVLDKTNSIAVYLSENEGASFDLVMTSKQSQPFVAPKIYANSENGFILFASSSKGTSYVSQSKEDNIPSDEYSDLQFSLNYSLSSDGKTWNEFSNFLPSENLKNPFAPVLCSKEGCDFVVFQAQHQIGTRISYQLYSTYSTSKGSRWSEPVMITNENSVSSSEDFSMFQNQRPNVYSFENNVYVAWERRYRYSDSDSIWIGQIDKTGLVPQTAEEIASKGNSKRAILFSTDGKLSLVWFDSRSGIESVYMAQRKGVLWTEEKISSEKKVNMFPYPIFIKENGNNSQNKKIGFIWQKYSGLTKDVPLINLLSPDISVSPPKISILNIKPGSHSKNKKVRLKINLPQDSSEVAGYVYLWTQNKDEEPLLMEDNLLLPKETSLTLFAESEGTWFFKACAYDYAGNWSKSSTISYYYDQTPPRKITFDPLLADTSGFMSSNTFSVDWKPSSIDDDVAGYTYSLKRIASIEKEYSSSPNHPTQKTSEEQSLYIQSLNEHFSQQFNSPDKLSEKIQIERPHVSFKNYPNGVYVLSVAAIDTVGFVGEQTQIPIILNKYIPHTVISKVETSSSKIGNLTVDILGNDFLYEGKITKIIIDKNGRLPYDYEITSGFKVKSNNQITGIPISDDIAEGSYFIGLVHSDRGELISYRPILKIENSGTIKIDNPYEYVPDYYIVDNDIKYHLDIGFVIFVFTILLASVFLVYFFIGILKNINDKYIVKNLVIEIRKECEMINSSDVKDRKSNENSRKKNGPKSILFEIIGFTFSLILLIVVSVAFPIYRYRISETEKSLASGLKERVDVLLSSLASGAKAYMPTNNTLELSMIPDQISALSEAEFATITGISAKESSSAFNSSKLSFMHVWASNDPDILTKIDTKDLSLGTSLITTKDESELDNICKKLNDEINNELGSKATELRQMNTEGMNLALKTDSSSLKKLQEITKKSQNLTIELNTKFDQFAQDGSGSTPPFDIGKLNREKTEYLFYRPVIFRMGSSNEFVRGLVMVRVSTVSLIKAVDDAKKRIIVIVSILTGVILIIGGIGSIIIGRHLALPIRTLEKVVQKIAQEKHKENLKGKNNIEILRNDEIGRLGDAMNRLKEELADAALEEKLTNDGKAVQKAFLPLDKSNTGLGQKTTASYEDKNIEAFGYYEGASAVSGDYFDYKKLDERWYVFIKSDASGHGTPAGLIMTVVATLFAKFFEGWSLKKSGLNITKLVYQINDFLESLGLRGKFATIILVLFDSESGKMYMCNAGDNLVHVYESNNKALKIITLKETPAAGPFPAFMVDMKGGFVSETSVLEHNDILFLYTDGIEESTRLVRDSNYHVLQEEQNGKIEDKKELLEADRVKQIIESVFARKKYILEKQNNPDKTETLIFDFTTCEGNSKEAIIALAAVEKVFRMYKPQSITEKDTIIVDRGIDDFLKKHFNLYGKYCNIIPETEKEDEKTEYVHYNFVMEDEQADDLTMLAIRRP